MNVIAMIPARYEASRFPGKLMQDLAGKSVILRTYEATINTGLFEKVFVVTDSKIIYDEINQIGVPESAVIIQGSTSFVYIVKNDTAEKRNIKIGNRNFGKISVESGIKEGDLVISEGVSKVRNKSKVKIINK